MIAYFGAISIPTSGRLKCAKKEASLSAIRVQKEVSRIGGGLVAIFPGSPGNRGPINHWELTDPSFWTLIAAKDGLFFKRLNLRVLI